MGAILNRIPGWGRIGNVLSSVGALGYCIPFYPILAWILWEISGGSISLYGLPGDTEAIYIGLGVGVAVFLVTLVVMTFFRLDAALGISEEGILLSSWFRGWTVPWSKTRFVAPNRVWFRDALGIPARHILTRAQAERAAECRKLAGLLAEESPSGSSSSAH